MCRVRRWVAAVGTALVLGTVPVVSAPRLVVEDTLWGFDGTVVPGRFGTLHAWVRNHGKDPFEGVIRLSRVGFAGAEQGLPLVVACYIAAGTERGVEFVVRVEDLSAATWELSWDEPRAMRASIQAPRQGAPATVILERGRFRPVQRSQFRGFAEERFPPSVAMTEALGAVILDHAPVFEEVRARLYAWRARSRHGGCRGRAASQPAVK
jgi:hypothetical protein